MVVNVHQRGIGIEVAHVVVGVFEAGYQFVAAVYGRSKRGLGKEIPVPLPL
jgi:hypothetical protein